MLTATYETPVTEETPIKRTGGIRRLGKFGVVGFLNTLVDFSLYNLLSSVVGLTLVQSNIISTTVAMMFSFLANKKLVFKKHDGHFVKQAIIFYAVTAFGLYVIQTGTIHLLTQIWYLPIHMVLRIAHLAGVVNHDEFLIKNSAKAAATLLSLTWNFLMYKKVVFR